jgi:tetratricopeptide (TPR) repeat protein
MRSIRRGIARAFVLFLIAGVAGLPGCTSKGRRHLSRAHELIEKHDLKGAQAQLRQAIEDAPALAGAHKSLARVDERLGDYGEAASEYQTAAKLSKDGRKLRIKARYCRRLAQIARKADKSLGRIEAGEAEQGMKGLRTALFATTDKTTRNRVLADINRAIPVLVRRGDMQAQQRQYVRAVKTYERAIRCYMLCAEAGSRNALDPTVDQVVRSAAAAARNVGAPDLAFGLLNDVLSLEPNNKSANLELAQLYLRHHPPDYKTAADLMERAGAPQPEVLKLRAEAKRYRSSAGKRRESGAADRAALAPRWR